MKLPTPVAARLALTAALLLLALPALARDLTVLLPDDIRPTAMQEVYLHGFATADGIAPVIEIFTGSADALRTRLAGGDADVTLLPGAVLAPFCEAGLLDKLDWPALGGKDRMLALGAAECGLGAGLRATVLLHTPLDPAHFASRKQLAAATWTAAAQGAATLRQNRPATPITLPNGDAATLRPAYV